MNDQELNFIRICFKFFLLGEGWELEDAEHISEFFIENIKPVLLSFKEDNKNE